MQCFAVWAAAVFQVRQVPHACVVCGLGVDEARIFCGLSALLVGGFEQSVFVFWFVLLFGMLLGVWGNTGLLF